ncbi:MAG: 3-phosphoshikimate 1-carboxyvinyltransferase [Propionibacteriaceae bacterium]|jgi:3-phosphoshikimate 1-carboxyvinyltransferase|nr:3-phosphoshikimate 1-carboxyvinyltransferase [Propionibacteriaceae bacterium]
MSSDSVGWAAPLAACPVDAVVRVPGSKSATARALVLSALAVEKGAISGGLAARDTDLMIGGLRALGAQIDDHDPETWVVDPLPDPLGSQGDTGKDTSPEADPTTIDCGLAGTVMRFLPPIAALRSATVRFIGDEAASHRPMEPLLAGLRQLGAHVRGQALPFTVAGPIMGGEVEIDASGSSQFVSALLLSAARFPHGLTIHHHGGPVPSLPHIDMTVAALEARGVAVTHDSGRSWRVRPGRIDASHDVIEPDLTTAAVFLAAAVVTGGRVTVPDWPLVTTQPGAGVLDILVRMGAQVEHSGSGVTVTGTGRHTGVDVDLHDTSELTPVIAALMALAEGASTIRGVAHIRGHETDRLAALSHNLTALGCDCRETEDGLAIRPKPMHGGRFDTKADHRMAHAGALIGLRVPGVVLNDVACTSKTMPGFPNVWARIIR